MMKKYIPILFGIYLICIAVIGYFAYTRYSVRIDSKKDLLASYATNTKVQLSNISNQIQELPSIVKPIVSGEGIINEDLEIYLENVLRVEKFYIANNYFIKGISVFDRYDNVFLISRDKDGEFIRDHYKSREMNILKATPQILAEKKTYSFIQPIFHDDVLTGNVSVNLDIKSLQDELFHPYIEMSDIWPTSVLGEDNYITFPAEDELALSAIDKINKGLIESGNGFVIGKIHGPEYSTKVLSHYEVLNIAGNNFGWVFSCNIQPIILSSVIEFLVLGIGFLILATIAMLILHRLYIKYYKLIKQKERQIDIMQTISQEAPVGILIFKDDMLFSANNAALNILADYISPNDFGSGMQDIKFPAGFATDTDTDSDINSDEFHECTLFSIRYNGKDMCLCKKQMTTEMYGSKYVIDSFWDITDIEQSRINAIRSEIAKTELLSRISTDFKKTLDNIEDAVVLLKQKNPEDTTVELIKNLSASLSFMINDMQDFADIEAGRVMLDEMPFNIITEIKDLTDKYMPEVRQKGLRLQAFISATMVRNVVGDAERFRQVLDQLLSNAVKFTGEGEIRISVETSELTGGRVLVRCSVEDTGQGMNHLQLKTLFSVDLRTKGEKEPVGLGLIISSKLIKMMGGTIRATSPSPIAMKGDAPGTEFIFTFQCFADPEPGEKLDFSAITSYDKLGVLTITDDVDHTQYLDNYMRRKDIRMDVFIYNKESADLLINKLIIDKGRYQIIVIDTSDIRQNFVIATLMHQHDFMRQCLITLIDVNGQKGNYLKARSLGVSNYICKNEYSLGFDTLLEENFGHLTWIEKKPTENLLKNLSILIAEDNLLSQTVAQIVFKNLGYTVNFAKNALELVSLMNQKNYDIIFMDLKFPPSDGFEIAQMLRQKGYKIPIIAMTSTLSKDNIKNISDAGMNGYLPKPLATENVKDIMSKWS